MRSTAEARSAVRLADIAREVGVSIVTVAKVVNNTGGKNTRVSEKTAEKIRSCVKRMEYHPNMLARGLVGKSSDLIGVVLDSCAPPVYHERLSLMEKYAALHGYRFMIGQAHDDVEKLKSFAHTFQSYGAAGIICLAHAYENANAARIDVVTILFIFKLVSFMQLYEKILVCHSLEAIYANFFSFYIQ